MNSFHQNLFKTLCGWAIGIPIISIIKGYNDWVISAIQCVFFALFYTFLDAGIKKISKSKITKQKKTLESN